MVKGRFESSTIGEEKVEEDASRQKSLVLLVVCFIPTPSEIWALCASVFCGRLEVLWVLEVLGILKVLGVSEFFGVSEVLGVFGVFGVFGVLLVFGVFGDVRLLEDTSQPISQPNFQSHGMLEKQQAYRISWPSEYTSFWMAPWSDTNKWQVAFSPLELENGNTLE